MKITGELLKVFLLSTFWLHDLPIINVSNIVDLITQIVLVEWYKLCNTFL